MTQQTRTVNKGRYESGDTPSGSDYVDLIDSFLALADTTAQTVTSFVTFSGGLVTTVCSANSFIGNAAAITAIGQGTVAPASGFWLTATEGNARIDVATTTRASGGTNGAVPASAQLFALVTVNGVGYRIALFNN